MDANILAFTPHFLLFKKFLLTKLTMFMSSLFLFLLAGNIYLLILLSITEFEENFSLT